ncbi:MAG: DUF448 domain-containing protein [Alphaproteobacteria bacterium]
MNSKPVERTCIVTRNNVSPKEAIRLVVSPNGQLLFDLKGNLPARGYWVTATRENFDALLSNPKRLKQIKNVKEVADDFIENLIAALQSQILNQLGLARRAGQLIFGFEKVKIWLKDNKPALALMATNGSESEIERLGLSRYDAPVYRVLTKEQQGAALGREHVVHIVLKNGKLAQNLSKDCQFLAGFLAK